MGAFPPEPLEFCNGIMPKRDESADKRFHGIYASARFAGITDKEFKGLIVDHCGVFTDLDAVRSERFVTAARFLDRLACSSRISLQIIAARFVVFAAWQEIAGTDL